MRKVIVTEFLSLDGVMENPTSWQQGFSSRAIGEFKQSELFESDALLLGRVTYEGFAEYWPTATETGEFGERMNSLPKFVATTTLDTLEWNAVALGEDVIAEVVQLKRQEGGNLLTYGSGTFSQTLLQHGLVDELRLLVYPVVAGRGKRFFTGADKLTLQLAASRELGAGVVLLTYAPPSPISAPAGA
ncbi:dihydrofolate reductase family protein [Deinococcus hopiensis]|uniref:Dihydrofolate reductase n=1 Tax=Deinococcus hopiensis KR-140 TaxID=695939 RepID=A0A1W1UTY8_9DEIO|nr:dihydrofolate reductase family protein [Deinococcus hopiensis]SMB84510.1 Dihydrofolate reductase [Deinococcus hopiensis KR-140]